MASLPDGASPGDATGDLDAMGALLAAAVRGPLGERQSDELFAALYAELHRIARRELFRGAGALTLGATTLLHETYLDLQSRGLKFPDRNRFFAYAARAMRGLIVGRVRQRRAIKRGGEFHLTSFDATDAPVPAPEASEPLEALSAALDALAKAEPALAELVELKYFCGFDFTEIAAMRGVSERTVQRHWDKARAFLKQAVVPL